MSSLKGTPKYPPKTSSNEEGPNDVSKSNSNIELDSLLDSQVQYMSDPTESNQNQSDKEKKAAGFRTLENLHSFELYRMDAQHNHSLTREPNNALDGAHISSKESTEKVTNPLTKISSIHGTTSKVVQNKQSIRKWDWNTLPKDSKSPLLKSGRYCIINLPIDGQTKAIKYDPEHNPILPVMDIFLSFNAETQPKDALVHAKRRLKSYVAFTSQYLKIVKDSPQISLLNDPTLISKSDPLHLEYAQGINEDFMNNYSMIGNMVHLWYVQLHKYLLQTNSLFFADHVVQSLFKRKSIARKSVQQTNLMHLQEENGDLISSGINPIDEIDILIIRPPIATITSWQVALDEPGLNVADYQINIFPWINATYAEDEQLMSSLEVDGQIYQLGSSVVIVSDEKDLIRLDEENASEYIYDCMDRKMFEREKKQNTASSRSSTYHDQNVEDTKGTEISPHNSQANMGLFTSESKKKKNTNKQPKKSGFVNFFRRKHTFPQLQPPISPTLRPSSSHIHQSLPETPTSSLSISPQISNSPNYSTNKKHGTAPLKHSIVPESLNDEIQSEWLEDHFAKTINNYKKISIPTQYYLPQSSNSPTTSNESTPGVGVNDTELMRNLRTTLYNKEYLQLKLPFGDNIIPSIFCPWIWAALTKNKWTILLRELLRCLVPEGHILALVPDLRTTNESPCSDNFPTTAERERLSGIVGMGAINRGLYLHPTKHLAKVFKDMGMVNVKSSVLSLKAGDLSTEMGCLNELTSVLTWNYIFRNDIKKDEVPKDTDPGTLFERYVKEHWGVIDDNAGCFRIMYVVGQKPKESNQT